MADAADVAGVTMLSYAMMAARLLMLLHRHVMATAMRLHGYHHVQCVGAGQWQPQKQ